MAHESPKRIRNVALVGHRGSGKTSVNEALLFTAGAINRLGSVADGTTVSDSAADEKAREMSISASLSSFRWDDRKINLIDTPGEPSFVADALCALRVCEGAVFVVNGVMGVEVTTSRLWERAADLGLARHPVREHARPRARRLLPRARLAQAGLRAARRRHGDPDRRRARARGRGRPDRHEGLSLRRRRAATTARRSRSPTTSPSAPQEIREKLMDEVAEVSDELMERYLEGEEISHEETVSALKTGVTEGHALPGHLRRRHPQPGHQPAARRASSRTCPRRPSGARSSWTASRSSRTSRRTWSRSCSRRWPTPTPGASTCSASTRACIKHDSQVHNCRAHVKERIGQLLDAAGQGDRARRRVRPRRHRRGGQAQGDPRGRRARRQGPRDPALAARRCRGR